MGMLLVAITAAGGAVLGGLLGAWMTYRCGRKLNDRRAAQQAQGTISGLLHTIPGLYYLHAGAELHAHGYWRQYHLSTSPKDETGYHSLAVTSEQHVRRLQLAIVNARQTAQEMTGLVAALYPGAVANKLGRAVFHADPGRADMPDLSRYTDLGELSDRFPTLQKQKLAEFVLQCDFNLKKPLSYLLGFVEQQLRKKGGFWAWLWPADLTDSCRQFKRRVICCRESCEPGSVPQQPKD